MPHHFFVQTGEPINIKHIGCIVKPGNGYIEIVARSPSSQDVLVYSSVLVGGGDVHLKAVLNADKSCRANVNFFIDTRSMGINGFRLVNASGYEKPVSAGLQTRQQMSLLPEWSQPDVPFTFELIRKGQRCVVLVDNRAVKHFLYGKDPFGRVGFCIVEGSLRIHDFYVKGETAPCVL